MAAPVTSARMFDLVMVEFHSLPRGALAPLAVLSVLAEAITLASWFLRPRAELLLLAASLLVAVAGLVVAYAASMQMIRETPTRRGLVRYLGVVLVMVTPLLAGLFSIPVSVSTGMSALAVLGFGLLLACIVLLPMLAAWPLLQSVSPRLIGPREAFRRSSGMRWPLVLLAFVVSGATRVIPETHGADTLLEAVLLAGLNAALGLFLTMLFIAVGVAAFKHMN